MCIQKGYSCAKSSSLCELTYFRRCGLFKVYVEIWDINLFICGPVSATDVYQSRLWIFWVPNRRKQVNILHFRRVTINLLPRGRVIWFNDEIICFLIESFFLQSPFLQALNHLHKKSILKENYLMAQFSKFTHFLLQSKIDKRSVSCRTL